MIVGLTYDAKEDWVLGSNDPVDANAEFDSAKTITQITNALESGGHRVEKIGNVKKLLAQIDDLKVDIVFNICEGVGGRNRESQVPVLLEMKGIPYVGSDALTLGITLDKQIAKKCFMADGLPTPRFFVAHNMQECEHLNIIGHPMIVKTLYEGTSKGLTEQSRVENYEGLKRQVDLINKTYHQPALVEEFIAGRECTVLVLGNEVPQAMPVVQVSIDGEVDLGNQFYTFERVADPKLRYICPAQLNDELSLEIQELAVRAFQSVGCRDVGRVDFRINEKGHPFILEINPLPAMGTDDVFNIIPAVIGSTYEHMINQVLNVALERYGLKSKSSNLQIQETISLSK